MTALIVVAHPEPTSFTAAMATTAERALRESGHEVVISDLYRDGFNPTAGRHDFSTIADGQRFHYQSEQAHAAANAGFSADLRREQERVASAAVLVFVFPIWWGGVPAILKGWFDRVLAYGFAYEDGMRYETGFFAGRAGLLGVTTGGTQRRFSPDAAYGTIEQVLWPTQHCMIEYLGLSTGPPFVAYASPRVSAEERSTYLAQWHDRVLETGLAQAQRPVHTTTKRSSSTSWSSDGAQN